eukprot:EG_transcript_349
MISKAVLSSIASQEMKPDRIASAIGVFMDALDNFRDNDSVQVFVLLVRHLQDLSQANQQANAADGRAVDEAPFQLLDAVPKLWAAIGNLSVFQSTSFNGREQQSKEQFMDFILGELCNIKWPAFLAVKFSASLKEMDLTAVQSAKAVAKVLELLQAHPRVHETPALVYQLVGLSSKGDRGVALRGIAACFSALEAQRPEVPESLCQVEGTVLLHLSFAMKQDPELAKELLRLVRAAEWSSLTAFDIAFLLAVSRLPAFERPAIDAAKAKVQQCFRDLWNAPATPNQVTPPPDFQSNSLSRAILDVVHRTSYGMEFLLPGVVALGATLMDTYSTAIPARPPSSHVVHFEADIALRHMFGDSADGTAPQRTSGVGTPTGALAVSACMLGMALLQRVFQLHDMVRAQVLELVFEQLGRTVVWAGAGAGRGPGRRTSTVLQYLCLLEKLVRNSPNVLLDHLTRLKEVVECVPHQPLFVAACLLTAVQPILRLSPDLQDYVLMVLRKAFHNQHCAVRMVAVNGFLQLLSSGRKVLALPTMSQFSTPHPATSSDADVELLGVLRRCLSQHFEVRERLYAGLYAIYLEKPHLSSIVLGLLLHQFLEYFERDATKPAPLNLTKCISPDGKVHEPIGHLLYAMQRCVIVDGYRSGDVFEDREGGRADADEPPIRTIQRHLDQLVTRTLSTRLEDWGVESQSTAGAGLGAALLCAVLEVLMEFVLLHSHTCDARPAAGSSSSASQADRGRPLDPFVRLFELHSEVAAGVRARGDRSASPKDSQRRRSERPGSETQSSDKPAAAGGRGRPAAWDPHRYLPPLSMEYSYALLKLLNQKKEKVEDGAEPAAPTDRAEDRLRNDYPFQLHLLHICRRQLAEVHAQQEAAGMTLFADPAPLATPSAATSSSTQLSVVDAQPRPRAKGSRLYSLLGTLAALLLRDFARHRDFLQHNKPLQKQAALATVAAAECFELCCWTCCSEASLPTGPEGAPLQRLVAFLDTALSGLMHLNSFSNVSSLREHYTCPREVRLQAGLSILRNFTAELVVASHLTREADIFLGVVARLHAMTAAESIPEGFGRSAAEARQATTGHLALEWCGGLCGDETLDGAPKRHTVKTLLSLYCSLSIQLGDVGNVASLAEDIGQVLCEDDPEPAMRIVTKDTAATAFLVVQSAAEKLLAEAEWAVDKLRTTASPDAGRHAAEKAKDCLLHVVDIEKGLAPAELSHVACFEQLVKGLTRLFKVVTRAARAFVDRKQKPAGWLEDVAAALGTSLTGEVLQRVISNTNATDSNVAGKQLKAKISRETRLVPALVYQFEVLQRYLARLDQKWGSHLLTTFKQPLNRDVRFKPQAVSRHLEQLQRLAEVVPAGDGDDADEEHAASPNPQNSCHGDAPNSGDAEESDGEETAEEAEDEIARRLAAPGAPEEETESEDAGEADGEGAGTPPNAAGSAGRGPDDEGGEDDESLPGAADEDGADEEQAEADDVGVPAPAAARGPPLATAAAPKRRNASLGMRRVKSKYF